MATPRLLYPALRVFAGALVLAAAPAGLRAQQAPADSAWGAVERALGRAGQAQPDGAFKFGFLRSDLTVTVSGVQLRPALALGSWVAFRRTAAARATCAPLRVQ